MKLLIACLCLLLQFGYGYTVSCQPGAELEGPASPSSSCNRSASCLINHPPNQEQTQCQQEYNYNEPSTNPPYIEECPRGTFVPFFFCSNSSTDHILTEYQYFKIASVNPKVFSLDPQHFGVNVSWNYPDREGAINMPRLGRRLSGYEVRVYQNDTVVQCWCVREPSVSSLILGTNLTLQYTISTRLKLEVRTLPFDRRQDDFIYLTSQTVDWSSTCNAIMHTPASCSPPPYGPPQHVRVDSRSAQQLQVLWSHPTQPPAPPPQLYYVYGYSERQNFSLLANGTLNITISDLDQYQNYSIRVQAYSHCSGLSYFFSGLGQEVGCGQLSAAAVPAVAVTSGPTSAAFPSTTTDHTVPISQPPIPPAHKTSPHPLLSLILVAPVIVVIAGLLGFVVYFCIHEKKVEPPRGNIEPDKEPDILVLYSLLTPLSEQILIQSYVVTTLKQQFMVRSCDDHTEKTFVQWVEEQARLARLILIVCNKSFYADWTSSRRSPLVNSLETIVTSAVSRGNISKYAVVILEKGGEKYIPENLYLKSMDKFYMGKNVGNKDLDKILHFMKNN